MLKDKIVLEYNEYINQTFKNNEIKQFLLKSDFVQVFHNKMYDQLALSWMTGKISPTYLSLLVKDLTRIFCRQALNTYENKIKTKQTTFNDFVGDDVATNIFKTQESKPDSRKEIRSKIALYEEELKETGELRVGDNVLYKENKKL